jgi:8-oxo-dGTP pyrophosphatase MutT (NUDIX family)
LRDEPELEVLMIKRHEGSAFAGGALVFPGGRVDPNDSNPLWREHAVALDPDRGPAQIAAIREAFEESGILIARGPDGRMLSAEAAEAYAPWRQRVEDNDAHFLDFVNKERLSLACDRLVLYAHWIPPAGLHNRRFDTLFFATLLPEAQAPLADGLETTEALWTSARAALERRDRSESKIIFPTARNLDLLALSPNSAHVFALARGRDIRPIMPHIEMRDGKRYLCIPEDSGYPVTSELLDQTMRG